MISAKEALRIVLENTISPTIVDVDLADAVGYVLAEDIYADRPFPPFDRVCMDGIAINYSTYEQGQRLFPVESIGAAGDPQRTLSDKAQCIEIMTGAPLPIGADTIIRYEDITETDSGFTINERIKPKSNIHFIGMDQIQGDLLLSSGTTIKAIDINILATVGNSTVSVYQRPRVAVISSGEELVPVSTQPLPHQIRRSNVHMMVSRLQELGIKADQYHFRDSTSDISTQLKALITDYDVMMISGGVSKGKFDFIPAVLEELKFKKLFHRVAQRPGKPFWFGRRDDKVVFAFPGNPVSGLACFHKYFIEWYRKTMYQSDSHMMYVALGEDVHFRPNLTYFAQARLVYGIDAKVSANVCHGNGSGDMVSPSSADGFVELPVGKDIYRAGETYRFIPFHPIFK